VLLTADRTPGAIESTKLLYLGLAFALVWIGIAGYLLSVTRRQKALEKRLTELQDSKSDSESG